MAESRRVQLFTLSTDAPSYFDLPSDPKCAEGGENVSDRPAGTETVRLVLELFEPDERSFPEFSYGQLIDDEVGVGATFPTCDPICDTDSWLDLI